jgi:hypothetical protein
MCPKQHKQREDGQRFHLCDSGFLSTIMYKVGYSHGNGFKHRPDEGHIVCKVSMADGWVDNGHFNKNGSTDPEQWNYIQWNGKQDFCDWLNITSRDEYRFATQEEVVRVVMYQSSRWR